MRGRIQEHPAALIALGALLSLVWIHGHTFPLDGLHWPAGDELLMVWNVWNVTESLADGRDPFSAPHIYHPLGARLAKHTYSPGFWPVGLATAWVTDWSPAYALRAYHLCVWLSFTLALAFGFLFLRRLGYGRVASFVPALQFAFSAFARSHVPHLQHLSALFLVPLVSLALLAAFRVRRPSRLFFLSAALGLGVYFSEMSLFLWLAILGLVLVGALLPSTRGVVKAAFSAYPRWAFVVAAIVFLATIAPFVRAWSLDPSHAFKTRQAYNGSANLLGLFLPHSVSTPLYRGLADDWSAPRTAAGGRAQGVGGHDVFLGYPLLVFAAAAVARRPRGLVLIVAILTAVFLVLSLGPALVVGSQATGWSLPYAALMKVPPFHYGRSPARNVVFVLWGAAILAAHGLSLLERALATRRALIGALTKASLTLWTAFEVYAPAPALTRFVPPPELARLPPGAVVNVPLSVFDGLGVFLQTFHGRPIVTGFASRRTSAQVDHIRDLDRSLREDPARFAARMEALGVGTVILGPGVLASEEQTLRGQHRLAVVDVRASAGEGERPQGDPESEGP